MNFLLQTVNLSLLPGKDGQQVPGVHLSLHDMTECLDEPTAVGAVPPAEEARDGAAGNQKVCTAGDVGMGRL